MGFDQYLWIYLVLQWNKVLEAIMAERSYSLKGKRGPGYSIRSTVYMYVHGMKVCWILYYALKLLPGKYEYFPGSYITSWEIFIFFRKWCNFLNNMAKHSWSMGFIPVSVPLFSMASRAINRVNCSMYATTLYGLSTLTGMSYGVLMRFYMVLTIHVCGWMCTMYICTIQNVFLSV